MSPLEHHLRRWVERAAASLLNQPDGYRQACLAVYRRVFACVAAAHGLSTERDPDLEFAAELDWAAIDLDDLARAYEGLLERSPVIESRTEHARKRSGTYYTPPELVDCLLDGSLEPALDDACAHADPVARLLALRVCDPACGSGRFLLAAARRITARVLAVGDRRCIDPMTVMATVIERCIYGVDVDPVAVELCRLGLQLAAGGRARHDHLRCGDALLGAPAPHASSWAAADAWCAAMLSPDSARVQTLAASYRFFHWSLAFPEVFAEGSDGFDVVLGNPPWEMLEQRAEAQQLIARSGRFPIGAAARKNLYVLFAELGDALCSKHGRLGMLLPTEIVQGAIAQRLARPWFEQRRCASVFDFQNRRPDREHEHEQKWFANVHPQLRFSLVCLAPAVEAPALCCDAASIADTRDPQRVYRQSAAAILRLCHAGFRLPLVRGPVDLRIHERAYARGRPLAELLSASATPSPPALIARLLFNFGAVEKRAKVPLAELDRGRSDYLRVYEGEHIHQFNHRYATQRGAATIRVDARSLADPKFAIESGDYLPRALVHARLAKLIPDQPIPEFLLVLRRQARAADAYVGISAIIPTAAVEGSLTCFLGGSGPQLALLCATFNSFAFNYLLEGRQTGPNVNRGVIAELPIVDRLVDEHPRFDLSWFCARVLELSYTAAELEPFARACGHAGPPFAWADARRHELRCELEAALFLLYGFRDEEVSHALDRFTIVARREQAKFGQFRTKVRILALYSAMQASVR